MPQTLNIAALQVASLSFDKAKLDYYLTIAKSKQCQLLVLGEYVINLFFKELEKTPIGLIKEQAAHQKEILKKLATNYNITLIAPTIIVEKESPKKVIMRFSPASTQSYEQQLLINYRHWNEERFFDNPVAELCAPMVFAVGKVKCAVMYGFETHFDPLWHELQKKKIDVVIVPTASTFDSKERWRTLLKSRAFLNSVYILRVNRVGSYHEKKVQWIFYGDSFLADPAGEITLSSGNKEEIMIATIDKEVVTTARKEWGFHHALQKRGML
jgi:predicted amidohydrolase